MECVRRTGADAVESDPVARSDQPDAAAGAVPDQHRTSTRQHRASILQSVDQVPAHRCLGAWRTGGLPLEDLRWHVACGEPGHAAAELLALRYLRGSQDRQELDS